MNKTVGKQPKTMCIVAGGEIDASCLSVVRKMSIVIGVDGGALWLVNHGVDPDVAIGDFDSVTAKEKRHVHDHAGRYIQYLPQKDETDLELAIEEAIRLKPKSVVIYGALGRRFDHALSAVQMLTRLESHNIYGEIVDNFNKINIVRRLMTLTKDTAYPYISIISLESTACVTLVGFVYNVSRKQFLSDSSLGVSNQIVDKTAEIIVHQGKILVVRSSDVRVGSRIS